MILFLSFGVANLTKFGRLRRCRFLEDNGNRYLRTSPHCLSGTNCPKNGYTKLLSGKNASQTGMNVVEMDDRGRVLIPADLRRKLKSRRFLLIYNSKLIRMVEFQRLPRPFWRLMRFTRIWYSLGLGPIVGRWILLSITKGRKPGKPT